MAAPVFIGDEVTAAGFRLAGVRVRTPLAEELPTVLAWAKRNTSLILITGECMAMLDEETRAGLVSQLEPAVVVVPDIRVKTPIHDLATQLRSQLGVLD